MGGMEWIDVARDRDEWQALLNAIIILLFPRMGGKFLTT